jgi:DnaK suppressor protein
MTPPELEPDQLAQLESALKEKRQDLEVQLESNSSNSKPVILDQQAVGRLSRMDAIQHQQMALANKKQSSNQLKLIDLALKRIDAGEYGFCFECEEPIAFPRLLVQPFARLCIDCQSASEST